MIRVCLLIAVALLSMTAESHAGGAYIAKNAKVISVGNTTSNLDTFVVNVTGGTGVCGNAAIFFPKSATDSPDVHSRAYATALTAFVTGAQVTIYNYHAEDCMNASYIRF